MINKLKNKYLIFRWRKKLGVKKHLQYIEQLFNEVNPYKISRQARQSEPDLNLTYGEIDLESLLALVSLTPIQETAFFYDLGCGIGKTLFAIAHTFTKIKCMGIEKLFPLIHTAQQVLLNETPTIQKRIHFIHEDLFNISWHQDSIVFINIASFMQYNWQRLNDKCMLMPAKIFITCCKPLNLANYHITETQVQCSWGIRPAYIHQVIDKN